MATRFKGSERQTMALDAYIALMRAAGGVTGRVHRHLEEAGLTTGQFAVLEALHHLGPMRQNELARKLLSSAGNLSIVLDNLEKSALVRRAPDPHDGRCTRVAATAAGRRLIGRIFPRHADEVAVAFAVLSDVEQQELRRLCRKLGQAGIE